MNNGVCNFYERHLLLLLFGDINPHVPKVNHSHSGGLKQMEVEG